MKKNGLREPLKSEFSFFLSVPPFIWVITFFYIPLLSIVARSFFIKNEISAMPTVSLKHYVPFFDMTYITIIKRSIFLALGTSIVCLLIAYPVAYFIARVVSKKWKNIFLFFIMLPFSVNLLIQAYSWFFVLGNTGLINTLLLRLGIIHEPLYLLNTPGAVYLGMVYCYVPFMLLPLYSSLEKIDIRFIEASLDLGASWYYTLSRVILPLSLQGVRTGFFLVFIPVFGEFVVPALLGGGKQMFVGSLISYYFLTTRNMALGSAFTCLSSLVLLIATFIIYQRTKKYNKYGG